MQEKSHGQSGSGLEWVHHSHAHRIGQQKPVKVIKLVADGTVDLEVTKISQRKAELEGSIIADAGDSGRRKASAMQDILTKALADISEG